MAYVAGKSGDYTVTMGYFKVRIHWEETYDILLNTSIVEVSMYLSSDSYSYRWYPNGTISVNGETVVTFNFTGTATHVTEADIYKNEALVVKQNISTVGVNPPWPTSAITHNADGSKKVTLAINNLQIYELSNKWSFNLGSASTEIELTTIPRASSVSLSASSVNVGNSITANITRASDSFTHTVEFYINSTYYKKYTNVGTSRSFTIPNSWYNSMPSKTSCTAYCRVTTYNGTTQIGDKVRTSFTVKVPNTIVPSIGEVELIPDNFIINDETINIVDGNTILVKNKNKLKINVSGCSAGTGSSIQSYQISGPSISTTITQSDESISYTSSNTISNVGTLEYKITVTDKRNRSAYKTVKLVCYDYYAPSFDEFDAYRVDSSGNVDMNGEYLKCTYKYNYADVNGTNNVSVKAYYETGSTKNNVDCTDGSVLINLGNQDKTYTVYLITSDNYGGSSQSSTITIFGSARILNITSDGTGVALGKMAESSNLFECRWDAKFDGAASGPSGFSTSSDKRVKKNIKEIEIDIVDNLRPIQYELTQIEDGKTHYGFIAQEVEELFYDAGLDSETVGIIGKINNNGQKEYVLTYTEFIPLLTKKCQSLQAETNLLKQEIEELKYIISQLVK